MKGKGGKDCSEVNKQMQKNKDKQRSVVETTNASFLCCRDNVCLFGLPCSCLAHPFHGILLALRPLLLFGYLSAGGASKS
jgi:hypothetical protein